MAKIKSFYKNSTDGAWKINNLPIPNGQFMGLYERTSYFTLVHPATVGNKPIFEPTLVTEIEKEDGSTYADKAEFELAIGDFFLRASGTGSGGSIIESNHIFASDTARDTYFSTDPNHEELLPGLSIISGGQIQRWAAATPATAAEYVGTNFVDITGASLTGAQIKALLFALNNTNNLDDAKLSILNLLTEQSDRVVSSKSFEFPPDTVFVSENLGFEGAGEVFAVWDRADNRRGYIVAYLRGVDEKPFYRNLDSFNQNVVIQGVKDTVSSSDTYTQNITFTEDRLITKVYLESPNDTTGADIFLRRGGFIVAQARNVVFSANTVKEIEIPQGIFCREGGVVTLDVQGVVLKGAGAGAEFQTAINLDNYIYTVKNLASEDFVRNIIASDLSIRNFSINIPPRVNIGTNLGLKTISFEVTNHSQITELKLQVNGVDFSTLVNPASDGVQNYTVDLSSINTSVGTTLIFRLQANGIFNSNAISISVANLVPHELLYWDAEDDNTAATFDYANAENQEVQTGDIVVPTFTGSKYLKIAYPNSLGEFSEIRIGGVDQTGAFTNNPSALTINSVSYDVLVSNNSLVGSIVSGNTITLIR